MKRQPPPALRLRQAREDEVLSYTVVWSSNDSPYKLALRMRDNAPLIILKETWPTETIYIVESGLSLLSDSSSSCS